MKERTVLITGASGAIGEAVARTFFDNGYRLLLCGRSIGSLAPLRDELGDSSRVDLFKADVSSEKDMSALFRKVGKKIRSLDALVAAAGTYGEIGSLEMAHMKRWREAFDVNTFGTALTVKYALLLLRKSGHGKIICFAGGGEGPLPHFTAYAASKGAVLRLVESLSVELEPHGVTINAVSPGLVRSGLTRALVRAGATRAGRQKYESAKRELAGEADTVPPERAAKLALFLASDESGGITGKNISAVWDNWKEFPRHLGDIQGSDVYTWRRIKPKDRGYDWN